MKVCGTAILGAAFFALATGGARAADVTADQYAAMGYYLRADAGWSFLSWTGGADDSGLAIGGGIGMHLNETLRSDLRIEYSGPFRSGGGAMDTVTATGNLYYDLPTGTAFTPYLGAGLGYGYAWRDGAADDQGLTYALMAGAGVALTDTLTLDVEYRFRDIMANGADPMEHQLLAGLRYEF